MPSRRLMLIVVVDRRRDAEETHRHHQFVGPKFAVAREDLGRGAFAPAHVRGEIDLLDTPSAKFARNPIHRRHVTSPRVSTFETTTPFAAQVAP